MTSDFRMLYEGWKQRQMEIQPSLRSIYTTTISSFKLKSISFCKTRFSKPYKNPKLPLPSHSHHTNPSLTLSLTPRKSIKQTTLFVENYHVTQNIQSLIVKLKRGNLSPLQVLEDDGDWNKTLFWAVVKFLKQNSRFEEISKVFDAWTKLQQSRINQFTYIKIISLLSDAGIMDEATSKLQHMKNYNLQLCSEVFNSIIHGYAQKGMFDDALCYLNEMKETNISPDTETYDGLIKAYGKFQMYDEMINCLKMMEVDGCSLDHVTYNLLIRELSKGGLLSRMERMYQTLLSKKMDLQSSTLVVMIEAYADFGVLEKMEKFYSKVMNSKAFLKERLVRKIARVYIENHMFSRLDELGNDIASKTGKNDLFWHLHLLSHACLLSKKGISSVIREMESTQVSWSVTVANIILLVYLKMKDFKQLSMVLSELPNRYVHPDIVTFGIVFDAHNDGFDWSSTLKSWRKYGYLKNGVEVNTDPLVFTAFGKGVFLTTIEGMNSLLEPEKRKEKRWTYDSLVDLVLKHHGYWPKLDAQIDHTSSSKW